MRILYIAVHSHVGWGAGDWLNCAFNENDIETVLYNFKKARKTLNEFTENPELIKVNQKRPYSAMEHNTWHARVKLFITKFNQLLTS